MDPEIWVTHLEVIHIYLALPSMVLYLCYHYE